MRIMLSLLTLLFFSNVLANEAHPRLFILHINGVNTTSDDAGENANILRQKSTIDSNVITWDFLYNPTTGGLVGDLWDVLKQKYQEEKEFSIDDYVSAYMSHHQLNYKKDSPEYQQLKNNIKDSYLKDPAFTGKNLKEIVDEFYLKTRFDSVLQLLQDDQTNKKAYVLLVPHSQGNLYANQLWDYLVNGNHFPRNRIAIFGIAVPTNKIVGDVNYGENSHFKRIANYITADNDGVINSLRVFSLFSPVTNSPLASSNIHLKSCSDDLCHSFLGAYLADAESQAFINSSMDEFLDLLVVQMMADGLATHDIRLLLQMSTNVGTLYLVNNNKIICTQSRNTLKYDFDKKIFNYYQFGNRNPANLFAYNDQLPSGEYFITSDENDYLDGNSAIRGNIISAQNYYYNGCILTGANEVKQYVPQDDTFPPHFQALFQYTINYHPCRQSQLPLARFVLG